MAHPILKEDKFYFCPTPADINIPFYIEMSGITYPNTSYRIERTAHDSRYYVLEFVFSGKGYIECDGALYSVSGGDFYILSKGHPHKYYSDKENPFSKIWINAGGTLIDALAKTYGVSKGVCIRSADVGNLFEDVQKLLKGINSANKNDTYRKVAAKICEIFIFVFSVSNDSSEKKDTCTAAKIKEYIDRGIGLDITLNDIEKHFYLDKSYIIYLFRTEFGTTPKQYILLKKVEAAKSLLSDPAVCTKEIADMLNFSSTQHFSAVFKRICGISPSAYRKSTKNNARTNPY